METPKKQRVIVRTHSPLKNVPPQESDTDDRVVVGLQRSSSWIQAIIDDPAQCKVCFVAKTHYVIFVDPDNMLQLSVDEEFDAEIGGWKAKEREDYFRIFCMITQVESGSYSNLSEKEMLNFKDKLATALQCSIEKEFEAAANLISVAEKYAESHCEKNSKTLYRKYSMYSLLVCVICGIVFGETRCIYNEIVWQMGLAALAGGVGAWLSIVLRVGKMKLDNRATALMFRWEVVTKIIAGIVSALFIAVCFKCKLILGVLQDTDNLEYALVIVGFISGFSERLTPSIIGKLVRENTDDDQPSLPACGKPGGDKSGQPA